VSSVHKPQVGAKNDIAKEEFFTKGKMGMEQGESENRNTESTNLETPLEEYENIFNVIDSELDALRSSINEESSKENDPLPSPVHVRRAHLSKRLED